MTITRLGVFPPLAPVYSPALPSGCLISSISSWFFGFLYLHLHRLFLYIIYFPFKPINMVIDFCNSDMRNLNPYPIWFWCLQTMFSVLVCMYVCIYLSIYVSIYLSIYLSIFWDGSSTAHAGLKPDVHTVKDAIGFLIFISPMWTSYMCTNTSGLILHLIERRPWCVKKRELQGLDLCPAKEARCSPRSPARGCLCPWAVNFASTLLVSPFQAWQALLTPWQVSLW